MDMGWYDFVSMFLFFLVSVLFELEFLQEP